MVVTAVVVVSSSGVQIARKIAVHFQASLHGKFDECDILIEKYPEQLRSLFIDKQPIIFIGALGILVRLLAPVITKKKYDPPVVVVAEDGSSVIPVLGGHSGANELAETERDDLSEIEGQMSKVIGPALIQMRVLEKKKDLCGVKWIEIVR